MTENSEVQSTAVTTYNSGRSSNPLLSLRHEKETQANRKDSQEYNKCQTSISFEIQKNKSLYKCSG